MYFRIIFAGLYSNTIEETGYSTPLLHHCASLKVHFWPGLCRVSGQGRSCEGIGGDVRSGDPLRD